MQRGHRLGIFVFVALYIAWKSPWKSLFSAGKPISLFSAGKPISYRNPKLKRFFNTATLKSGKPAFGYSDLNIYNKSTHKNLRTDGKPTIKLKLGNTILKTNTKPTSKWVLGNGNLKTNEKKAFKRVLLGKTYKKTTPKSLLSDMNLNNYDLAKTNGVIDKNPENFKYVTVAKARRLNDAQLSKKWNNATQLNINDIGKFHLVTDIVLVTHRSYSQYLFYNGKIPTMKQLEDRKQEISECLQGNLNHPMVAAVHILYYHPAVMVYLLTLPLANSHKMVLHATQGDPGVVDTLRYIHKYLLHKYVMFLHQDNLLGEGWEDIDFLQMRKHSLMYALTRHVKQYEHECSATYSAHCNPGSKCVGSHDAFMFYSEKPFEKEMLKDLSAVKPTNYGMENVLIWYFRKMGYKVTNPCWKLKLYNNHCVPIRDKGRKKIDGNMKGKARFTDKLS